MLGVRKGFAAFFIWFTLAAFAATVSVSSSGSTFDHGITVEPHDHNALKPPPPPGSTPVNPKPNLSCGLVVPSVQTWNKEWGPQVAKWFEEQYNLYLSDSNYKSLPTFLRDRFAPDVAPGSLFCDTFGDCSISSCSNLKEDLSQHDKQMAYFVFEQISGLNHLFASLSGGLDGAHDYMLERAKELVDKFSSAGRIEKTLRQKRKREKVIKAITSGIGLVAGGYTGLVAAVFPKLAGAAQTSAVVNLVVGEFIGITGALNALADKEPDLDGALVDDVRASINEVRRQTKKIITAGMRSLMAGEANHRHETMVSFMKGKVFLGPDVDLQARIQDAAEQMAFAVIVNAIWGFDRAYILDTDAPHGYCVKDPNRGPVENTVCLPETPDRVYWLYALDPSEEDDQWDDDQVQLHRPTGDEHFDGTGNFNDHYGITKEDIVRSSLLVHRHNIREAIDIMDVKSIYSALSGEENLSKFAGGFAIPVCRNPYGESITSNWSNKCRNYPCMCGEFGWHDGRWSLEKDETKNFLVRTGFMFSEDWEDYCHSHNDCLGYTYVDWHSELVALRKPGDPQVPHEIQHPFWKCKSRKCKLPYYPG